MKRETLQELAVFGLLLAIGVAGRWAQPTWNFTPLAAVTVLGGYYFRQLMPALLLPVGVLALSDILLPSHDSFGVQLSVHLMMVVPLLIGRKLRDTWGWQRMAFWAMGGVVPATAFYLVTNFAVWAFKSDYPSSVAGLVSCYTAGIPFYRMMLAGDIFYLTLLASCLALAGLAMPNASRKKAA